MNSRRKKELGLPGGEKYHTPSTSSHAYMRRHGHAQEPAHGNEATPPAHRRDVRQLVRLIQCPSCSRPFSAPVTLPCGHTLCRACLPEPRPRAHVSYPNVPDRLSGVVCPVSRCGAEHAAAECNVDVTMSKLMAMIRLQMARDDTAHRDTPTLLEEVRQWGGREDDEDDEEDENDDSMDEKEIEGHSRVLHGGRLLSTYHMADMGELRYNCTLRYESLSPSGDDYHSLDAALLERLRDDADRELDCLVCYHMMLDPTTTSCGHTFCRRCLARVMDHSSSCPVCRRDLHIPASLQNKRSNVLLNALLDELCPDLVAARALAVAAEEQAGNDALDTPIFICTLAMPAMPTFLHVFEPRYRLMMRRCLEGNRQFGMVMYNRNMAPQGELGPTQFLEYGTLLEIVNYELLLDGRSFVETRGIGRFKIRAFGKMDGYHVSRVERVDDLSLAEEGDLEQSEITTAHELAEQFQREHPETPMPLPISINLLSTQDLLDACMTFVREMRVASAPWLSARIVSVYGEPPDDPALFPYWFASVLPIAEEEKYVLLQTTRVRERLKIVYSWIGRIQGQRW